MSGVFDRTPFGRSMAELEQGIVIDPHAKKAEVTRRRQDARRDARRIAGQASKTFREQLAAHAD